LKWILVPILKKIEYIPEKEELREELVFKKNASDGPKELENSPGKRSKDFKFDSITLPPNMMNNPERQISAVSGKSDGRTDEVDSDENSPMLAENHQRPHNHEMKFLPSFSKLLMIDEKDDFFDNWTNFYSPEFPEAFESLYKEYVTMNANRKLNAGFGEPIAVVKMKDEDGGVTNTLFDVKDFDGLLFESYVNTYSKEYEEAGNKAGMWKAATSFFRMS